MTLFHPAVWCDAFSLRSKLGAALNAGLIGEYRIACIILRFLTHTLQYCQSSLVFDDLVELCGQV